MSPAPAIDHHVLARALSGDPEENGDLGLVIEGPGQVFLALVDALGHGREARQVALAAQEYLRASWPAGLLDLMQGLHGRLKGTRGAVAALCALELASGNLEHCGVGNISARVFGQAAGTLLPRQGVIGYMMARPALQQKRLFAGDILVLASDGLKEHYSLQDHPQLLEGGAAQIAQRLMQTLGKESDDASCVVLRYGP